ncbi:hypothetical protein JW979_01990 [bacterium]|nr:hypothetical protein [candidate division CSSED10-310 bacterium]
MITVTNVAYGGWLSCIELTNGSMNLVVTTDVGPRVIRFGFVSQHNEFWEDKTASGLTGGDEWRVYGGHRLWHAPEDVQRTYCPDNNPVQADIVKNTVILKQTVEQLTGIEKRMKITMMDTQPVVSVVHYLINRNETSVELAPWALTAMAAGGIAMLPHPARGEHPKNLLPSHTLSIWAYTDMQLKCWDWTRQYVILRHGMISDSPQKIGMASTDGWIAYWRQNHLFVKLFFPDLSCRYPDRNSTAEIFANRDMVELETLGPLSRVSPGGIAVHEEMWCLFDGIPEPLTVNDVDNLIAPQIKNLKTSLSGRDNDRREGESP